MSRGEKEKEKGEGEEEGEDDGRKLEKRWIRIISCWSLHKISRELLDDSLDQKKPWR